MSWFSVKQAAYSVVDAAVERVRTTTNLYPLLYIRGPDSVT